MEFAADPPRGADDSYRKVGVFFLEWGTMDRVFCLAAGTLAGGFGRWLISDWLERAGRRELPWGTLLVNLFGCLLIGFLHGLGDTHLPMSPRGKMLLMVGFCGALTTFSTLMLESHIMIGRGNARGAFAYVIVSVVFGLALLRAGAVLSTMALRRPALAADSRT